MPASNEWGGKPTRSPHWDTVRKKHLMSLPTCAACGTRRMLEVHHILPYHLYPELELCESNLVSLCSTGGGCHITWGHMQYWKAYNPDVLADAASYLKRVKSRPVKKL